MPDRQQLLTDIAANLDDALGSGRMVGHIIVVAEVFEPDGTASLHTIYGHTIPGSAWNHTMVGMARVLSLDLEAPARLQQRDGEDD